MQRQQERAGDAGWDGCEFIHRDRHGQRRYGHTGGQPLGHSCSNRSIGSMGSVAHQFRERKGAPLSPQGRDKRRSWGFWLVDWRFFRGTSCGGSRFARVRSEAPFSAQISSILIPWFMNFVIWLFPAPSLSAGRLPNSTCAKRRIFLALRISAKAMVASSRDSVPAGNKATQAGTRTQSRTLRKDVRLRLLKKSAQAAAPPLFSRLRIS
jgi:hypothetical protein